MSRLAAILGAALLIAAPPAAQNAWPATPEQQLHAKVVRAERTAMFFTAWEEADVEHRVRATAFLAAARSSGAPEGRRPELATISAATHVLGGVDSEVAGSDGLQRFADALDLQVSPGFFPAKSEGEGEPMTVRFYRLLNDSFHEDVILSLLWIGPDGTEIRARTEHVAAHHFGTPGQVMYVRAPLTRDGEWWRLVPEVEFEGRRVRGSGILVCAVPLEMRDPVVDLQGSDPAYLVYAKKGLRAISFRSRPRLAHPLVSRSLTLLGARWPDAGPEAAGHGDLRFQNAVAGKDERIEPHLAPTPRTMILILTPAGECAESVFLGPVGDAWGRLARDHGAELCSVEFTRRKTAELLQLIEAWKATSREVILVARGDAVTPLPFVFAGKDVSVDGIVLCTETSGYPRTLPLVPTLLVAGSMPEADPGRNVAFVLDPVPVFLRELNLPDRIATWLAEKDAR